jgi:hypothetical protein
MYNSAAFSPFTEKMTSIRKVDPDKEYCGNTIEYNFSVKILMLLSYITIP